MRFPFQSRWKFLRCFSYSCLFAAKDANAISSRILRICKQIHSAVV